MPIPSLKIPIGQVVCLTFATLLSIPQQISGDQFGLTDDQHSSIVHVEINGDPHSVTGCCPRCSGVLVSLKHVVTVATCLWSSSDALPRHNDIQVYAGSSEISGQVFTDNKHLVGYGACSRSVQVVTARNVIYHPKFQPQFYQLRHDVALVLIPPLKATRFVAPIPLTFDMFDGASGISKECKIVGYSILKFPRAGYYNLITWLQPMTRWERDVIVTNGCMGKPVDWGKKRWTAMVDSELCTKVHSNDPRTLWNDKGAALICNGFLAGIAQGQFEDGGKLDLSLRQNSEGKLLRQQVIFFNMKHLAELIVLQMKPSQDLQWSGDKIGSELDDIPPLSAENEKLGILGAGDDNETLITDFEWASKFVRDFLNSSITNEFKYPVTTSRPATTNQSTAFENSMFTPTSEFTTESGSLSLKNLHNLAIDELPEFEMSLVTNEFGGEDFNKDFSVDDIFKENNPFNASWGFVHHVALVLNTEFQSACTGVFISPQSVLTTASCLVRSSENYLPLSIKSYRVITGHSNGMLDFCSDRIRTYGTRNITLLNQGIRQPWQIYRKSRIAPFAEIYNLAILTIDGAHLSSSVYPTINSNIWRLTPHDRTHSQNYLSINKKTTDSYASLIPEASLTPSQQGSQDVQESHNDQVSHDDPHQEPHPLQMSADGESKSGPPTEGLQCRMFGYGHMSFPFTNQKDRIGIKALELEITENCTRPYYDYPFGEESENLWQTVESPHFLCTMNLSPSLGPSKGSMGSPLYCGPDNKLAGIYIGRYNNVSFDSYLDSGAAAVNNSQTSNHTSQADIYTHVFLRLADYSEWLEDVLLDEEYVQLRRARLSLAPPMGRIDWALMCLLSLMPRLLAWSSAM